MVSLHYYYHTNQSMFGGRMYWCSCWIIWYLKVFWDDIFLVTFGMFWESWIRHILDGTFWESWIRHILGWIIWYLKLHFGLSRRVWWLSLMRICRYGFTLFSSVMHIISRWYWKSASPWIHTVPCLEIIWNVLRW